MKLLMRIAIVTIGAGAVWMALEVQSVQALWFFTSDLVFVLLFPQLVSALFDSKANLAGSMAAFGVSLVLRIGGGEPLFGIPALIPISGVGAVQDAGGRRRADPAAGRVENDGDVERPAPAAQRARRGGTLVRRSTSAKVDVPLTT